MNNYQRIEINLLPPEMAPGPAVRLHSVFNAIIGAAAVVYVAWHLVGNMSAISTLEKLKKEQGEKIIQQQAIVDEYMALKEIKDNTEGRGKLVGMASSTYVEYPIILDRVSRLLPPGVALIKTSSGGGSGSKELVLEFRTANGDQNLMTRTLEAFKSSAMFRDPYLRTGNFRPQPLDELSEQFGIPYRYQGPAGEDAFITETYDFEIRAQVNSPLEVDDLSTVMDKSEYMEPFELKTDPSAPPQTPAPGTAGQGGAAGQPASAPAGGAAPAPAAGGAAPAAGGAG